MGGLKGFDYIHVCLQAALKFGAKQMILLVFPVFICMALVVIIQLSVENNVQGGFGQLGGL
jgi:hypothetical protein